MTRLGQDIGRTSVPERLVGGAADGLVADAEQTSCLVVEQADASVAVQGDDTFPDAVQHGLTLREQRGDVGEGQVPGLSLHPAGDQPGGQRADGESPARVGQKPWDRMDQPGPHTVVADADGNRPDDLVFAVVQRHLAAGRAAQGAAVDLHDLPVGQGTARVGRDGPADLTAGGVRPAHAPPVHHHDVLRPGRPADPLGLLLHGTAGQRGRVLHLLGDLRPGGDGLGDGESPAHRLVVQLVAQGREEQAGREHRDPRGDRQLHQKHLGERPAGQSETQTTGGGVRLITMTVRGHAGSAAGGVAWIS